MFCYLPLSTVVSDVEFFQKILEYAELYLLVPLLGLLLQPGEAVAVRHAQVEEEDQREVANKLGEIRPQLVLKPDAADVQFLEVVWVKWEFIHFSSCFLELVPDCSGNDLLVSIFDHGQWQIPRGGAHRCGLHIYTNSGVMLIKPGVTHHKMPSFFQITK